MEWRLTLKKLAEVTGGTLVNCDPDEIVRDISKDSRQIQEGAVYIALKGANFNGHSFVEQSVEKGAICAVVDADEGDFGKMPYLQVENTYTALRDIAEYYRSLYNINVVGITGSVGKTSTKEMIACVLEQKYKTHKTEGNFNNEIGLPLTILRLSSEDEISVVEMGMSAFGEISRLTKIARPDTAVITNIGVSHIENLGSRENIKKAKFEILEGISYDGTVILNGDDDLLRESISQLEYETLSFGIENKNCDIVATDIKTYSDSSVFSVRVEGKLHTITVNAPGQHHVYNAMAAILVGLKYGLNMTEILNGIREFKPSGMRQSIIKLPLHLLIKDCYNASPTSMKSGIEVLMLTKMEGYEGRKVACLADMLELGDISVSSHRQVGQMVKEYGVDCLITVGALGKEIANGAIEAGFDARNIHSYGNNEELKKELKMILHQGDTILVKGSRSMHLEEIAEEIEQL